jgi:hypothetical protein
MGPVNRCSQTKINARLCPHCFNGWLGRETGWGPVNRSADGLGIMSIALFLGSSGPAQLRWHLYERLPHMACHERIRVMCIRFLLQEVHRFKSRSEITYRGRSWLGKPVGNPASARGCFSRHSLAVAPVCRGTTT